MLADRLELRTWNPGTIDFCNHHGGAAGFDFAAATQVCGQNQRSKCQSRQVKLAHVRNWDAGQIPGQFARAMPKAVWAIE